MKADDLGKMGKPSTKASVKTLDDGLDGIQTFIELRSPRTFKHIGCFVDGSVCLGFQRFVRVLFAIVVLWLFTVGREPLERGD